MEIERNRSRSRSKSPIAPRRFHNTDFKQVQTAHNQLPSNQYNLQNTTTSHERDALSYRKTHAIKLGSGQTTCPPPITQFDQIPQMPGCVLEAFKKAGFRNPLPIQAQSWSILMQGNDQIGIAQTGSGKTLAFLIPCLLHIFNHPRQNKNPIGLILAPTRELAVQIQSEFKKFGGGTKIKTACLYGGQPKKYQTCQFETGCDLVIGCPGRLIDFADCGNISLKDITFLVLDEADKMLDMGFEPQLRKLVAHMNMERQTVLFSATWPRQVQKLAYDFCKDPIHLQIGDTCQAINTNIKQQIYMINEDQKIQLLQETMRAIAGGKCIIFAMRKTDCDSIMMGLNKCGYKIGSLHGDKTMQERESALEDFRSGKLHGLVATDIAQRGLDIKDLDYVINFEMPQNLESYIHRIGRTGRAGKQGTAISFFDPKRDFKLKKGLVSYLRQCDQPVPIQMI